MKFNSTLLLLTFLSIITLTFSSPVSDTLGLSSSTTTNTYVGNQFYITSNNNGEFVTTWLAVGIIWSGFLIFGVLLSILSIYVCSCKKEASNSY